MLPRGDGPGNPFIDPEHFTVPDQETDMVNRIEEARHSIDAASDETEHRIVREQLRTLSEGLLEVEEDEDRELQGERLEEIEAKLTSLADEAADDSDVLDRIEAARDLVDAYRRDRTREWQEEGAAE